MRYRNPQVREALAAEYALGTLQGAARRRLERSLKDNPGLRRLVDGWQERLAPLGDVVEPVQPSARVWRNIQARIQPSSGRRPGFWENLGFWRGAGLVSTAVALALAVYLGIQASRPETMLVVMSGDKGAPAMTVSWPAEKKGQRKLRVRVLPGHPPMDKNTTSWELWMLPGGDQKPVSLGLIGTDPTQEVVVPENLAKSIDDAYGLAMSVEPVGGSPTGLPTGPVIFKGLKTKL